MWGDPPSKVDDQRATIAEARQELVRRGRFSRLHWVVVLLSLSLTLVASAITKHEVDARAEAKFGRDTDRSVALLTEQLRHYEGALQSGVAAIQANGGDMTDEQWKVYADVLDIVEKFPGANGIGIIRSIAPDDVEAFVAEQRITRPGFEIHPPHDRGESLPITSIEPVETNRAAVGLDMAHERGRFNGISMARTTGLAWMTGPIVLVQDEGQTPGFLFFAPWYDNTVEPPSADRADDFVGAVYAPFVVKDLVEGALVNSQRSVAISISDGGQSLFDENIAGSPGFDADPMFQRSTELQLYGRRWVVTTTTTLDFRAAAANKEPVIILAGGLTIDALLVALFAGLTRSNRRAIRFADDLTGELVSNGAKLEESNIELERFAYVASHDLKTPLRGIGSLVEWIEEDLDDHFGDAPVPVEVKSNLDRLHHQLDRMNDLIAGLLHYSRVGHEEDLESQQVDIEDHLCDLRLDLELDSHQLTSSGDCVFTTTSASLLYQVVSNLVTNAVQHHPDRSAARIEVQVELGTDSVVLSVIDDGAGIEAQHQKQIFEVFQTLGGGSTGIGLSVVRKIVDRQGGSIRVDSAPGEGSAFVVFWPLGEARSNTTTNTNMSSEVQDKSLEMSAP